MHTNVEFPEWIGMRDGLVLFCFALWAGCSRSDALGVGCNYPSRGEVCQVDCWRQVPGSIWRDDILIGDEMWWAMLCIVFAHYCMSGLVWQHKVGKRLQHVAACPSIGLAFAYSGDVLHVQKMRLACNLQRNSCSQFLSNILCWGALQWLTLFQKCFKQVQNVNSKLWKHLILWISLLAPDPECVEVRQSSITSKSLHVAVHNLLHPRLQACTDHLEEGESFHQVQRIFDFCGDWPVGWLSQLNKVIRR